MFKHLSPPVVIAIAIGLALFVLVLFARTRQSYRSLLQFKAKPFLTPNELEFLERLESAVPELRFHAQVSMGALLQPATERRRDNRAYYSARGMFSQKIVDFVAQRKGDGTIVAIIELDDRTHDRTKDAKRDAMLAQGGYRTVRWHSKQKPSPADIRLALADTDNLGRIEPRFAEGKAQ